ncbi:MAG: hypothetical protein E4G96_02770 [Chrysiogenales bacterium]|nr:MAG: hypothetical protein E4G96_02770 [Chrysiogenales bacterium]
MDATTRIIIVIVAIFISSGFLAIVIVLVPAIRELRALLVDMRKTSEEVRDLASEAKKISVNIENKLEGIDGIISNSKRISSIVGKAASRMENPAFKHLEWVAALVPALILGWKAVSGARGGKKEEE